MKTFKQFLLDPGTSEREARAVRVSTARRRQISELIKRLKSVKTRSTHA